MAAGAARAGAGLPHLATHGQAHAQTFEVECDVPR